MSTAWRSTWMDTGSPWRSSESEPRAAAQFGPVSAADAQVYLDVLHTLKEDGLVPSSGVRHVYAGQAGGASPSWRLWCEMGNLCLTHSRVIKVEVVLPETPFYLESGGQVSDTGTITASLDMTVKPAMDDPESTSSSSRAGTHCAYWGR